MPKGSPKKRKFSKANKKAKIAKAANNLPEERIDSPLGSKIEEDTISSVFLPSDSDISKEMLARLERKRRFKLDSIAQSDYVVPTSTSTEKLFDPEDFDIIRGSCTSLEKSYLRLTSVSKFHGSKVPC